MKSWWPKTGRGRALRTISWFYFGKDFSARWFDKMTLKQIVPFKITED